MYEKLGIDCLSLAAADAALVMQYHYDFNDPRKVQEDHYPVMCWSQNYRYAGNAIPWTLFFAGRIFAPAYEIDGVNVQDYMQVRRPSALCSAPVRARPQSPRLLPPTRSRVRT